MSHRRDGRRHPLRRAGIASFDDDGRFAASRRGIVEVASGGQVGGTVAPNNDVVEAKGEDHLF